MLDDKKSKWWIPNRKSQSSPIAPDSPIASTSEDETFIAATRDYLISPTAVTLGLPGSSPTRLSPVPQVYLPPGNNTPEILSRPVMTSIPTVKVQTLHSIPSPAVPEDAKSTISSIVNVPWPQPPSTPPGIVPVRNFSRPLSPAPLNLNSGYPVYPTIVPSQPRPHRPFQDSFIPPSEDVRSLHQASRSVPKRPSASSLRRTLSGEKFGLSGSAPASGDVIYMTVVKETV
jgi:hypothetical protein